MKKPLSEKIEERGSQDIRPKYCREPTNLRQFRLFEDIKSDVAEAVEELKENFNQPRDINIIHKIFGDFSDNKTIQEVKSKLKDANTKDFEMPKNLKLVHASSEDVCENCGFPESLHPWKEIKDKDRNLIGRSCKKFKPKEESA